MSRLDRCCKAGRRARQYYGRPAWSRIVLALLVFVLSNPSYSQSLLRIQVLEGEGSVNGAGSRSERPIAVQLTDETGRPLEGVAVSFRLPEEGPGGAFEGGMKTEIAITTADGRAAVHGIRWNRVPGPFQMRITAAKGESRAGAICSQYISETTAAKTPSVGKSGKKKWLLLAGVAAGAAAAGVVATGGSKPSTSGPPTSNAPVQIGPPTISIGKP